MKQISFAKHALYGLMIGLSAFAFSSCEIGKKSDEEIACEEKITGNWQCVARSYLNNPASTDIIFKIHARGSGRWTNKNGTHDAHYNWNVDEMCSEFSFAYVGVWENHSFNITLLTDTELILEDPGNYFKFMRM